MDCGFILWKLGDSFAKPPRLTCIDLFDSVRSNLARWIQIGRLRVDRAALAAARVTDGERTRRRFAGLER